MRLGKILTNAIEVSVRPVRAAGSGLSAAPLREGVGVQCARCRARQWLSACWLNRDV